MKFKNYCMVVMGKTEGFKLEIGKLSEGSPRFLEARGITISTFVSVADVSEISDYFKSLNRNFLIFETDNSVSGFNLNNQKLYEALFGHLNKSFDIELEDMTNKLMDDINETSEINTVSGNTYTEPPRAKTSKVKNNNSIDIENMSQSEREELLNTILDKGADKLTNKDRELLDILIKIG